MPSTTPEALSRSTKSPTPNWSSTSMKIPEIRSLTMLCTPKAMVTAITEVPATIVVMLKPSSVSTVTFVIIIVTALMILAELGFNITTIVAGTSVVAVTIAFGVQSIVKDLVSGIFLLVEDQLGVGDFVDMERASGVVEAIGLRVTQLRADDGTVWYVRNGEVLRVGNFSQGGPGRPPATEAPPADVTPPATPPP